MRLWTDMKSAVVDYDALTLDALLEQVYQYGAYNFRGYKRGTVTRRLARRLHATGSKTYREYMQYLETHSEEYQKLADELIINVSGFFRNQYAFKQVVNIVLPQLFTDKEDRREREVKLWSAACACGEEPYSIAIMLAEFMKQRRQDINISIQATDISRRALSKAEKGVYSPGDLATLPQSVLRDYFIRDNQQCEIRADIRNTVSFSCFDLTSTDQPPFSNVDCIFCCNVLIYLQKSLQEKVLQMLYNALAVPGYLVLGEVETPTGGFAEKLECLDSKAKIYKKMG